jgi:hypothetical protein
MSGDPEALAAYRDALAQAGGQPVIFRRISGQAPNTAKFDAQVTAIFRMYQPTGEIGSGTRSAGITEGTREYIVLSDDLAAARFPLPLQKNDKILPGTIVNGSFVPGTEQFNITEVDPGTRIFAGALQGKAVGV